MHLMGASCNYPGPHQRGTDRYAAWSDADSEATGRMHVWRSADAGVTWAGQDVAAMPQTGNPSGEGGAVCTERLNADTIRIAYTAAATGAPAVRDFDMASNALGPILYSGIAGTRVQGYHRSTVAAEDRLFVDTPAGFGLGSGISLYRHDGSGFLPEIVISDNVSPLNTFGMVEALFMDPAGTSHVFYSVLPRLTPFTPRTVYYRQVGALGAMTAPVVVYTYNVSITVSKPTFGFPALLGTMLVVPFPKENGGDYTGSMLVLDPYTSPAPIISQVDLPTQYLGQFGTIQASPLGSQMYLWWLENLDLDGVTPLSRIMYTTYNGGAIPAPTIFHDELANPSFTPIMVPDTSLDGAYSVAVSGNLAYVAAYDGNALTIVDVTNPAVPIIVGTVTDVALTGATGVAVVGNFAYVTAGGSNALTVVDVTNPAAPVVVGTVTDASLAGPNGVAVSGNLAYVAAGGANALTVVDVTNPAAPVVAGTVTDASLNGAQNVAVFGTFAYVTAATANALTVVDVTNPAAPVVAGTVTDASLTWSIGVAVAGSFVYVASYGANALTVVDVTNPAAPVVTGSVADGNLDGASSVALAGNLAYVAAQNVGYLAVVDVTNPAAPVVLGTVPCDSAGVAVLGNHAYVATGVNLAVVDVTNPAVPLVVGAVVIATHPVAVPGAAMSYLSPPFMDVVDPMLLVSMLGGTGSYYWFSIAGPPPPPGTPFQPLTQGSRRMHVLVPNRFDGCLAADVLKQQNAKPLIGCCRPEIVQNIGWVKASGNSVPFRKVAAIPTPLAASGDVQVLEFQVPTGYDGLISGLFHLYTGPGFMTGSGDIEWRIKVNKTYAVHLGQILVTLGSQRGAYSIDGGIPVQSGQRIQYIVNAPNLSGGLLPLNSQIVCGLEGLFYARQ